MRHLFITLILCLFFVEINAQTQEIDTENSIVNFAVSNMKFRTVEGAMDGMEGEILFEENQEEPAAFNVCINPATVDTDNRKRDEHLLKEDFFDVANHLSICFESSDVTKASWGYSTKGTLTINGIDQLVTIPFTFDGEKFQGNLQVLRSDFELGPSGTFMIGDEVEITIICTLK